jgi:hypothetical protein
VKAARASRSEPPILRPEARYLSRRVFLAFLLTFITARVLVFLIMARQMPDLFLHLGGTHVHHLNYGIFLLTGLGAVLLLVPLAPSALGIAAWVYGVALALTFDEFGMWLHLGGGSWQRESFDAMTVLAAVLGLAAFAPPLRGWRPRHWASGVLLALVVAGFYGALAASLRWAAREEPRLERLERRAPS